MIEIYGKKDCPQCDTVKKILDSKEIPYEYRELDVDFTREQLLEMFPKARTFPQIKIHGEVLGGYKEFMERF